MPVDYCNGKVYKVEAKFEVNVPVYVGSTTKPYLSQRFDAHKQLYKAFKGIDKKTKYCTVFQMFEKYGVDGVRIVLIEAVNAKSKDELLAREAYFINLMNSVNAKQEQRCQLYNTLILNDEEEYKKTLHPDQVEYFNIKKNEENFISSNQLYRIKYNKEYYEKNKNKALEKFICICGSPYTCNGKMQHLKSKKHKKYTIENNII